MYIKQFSILICLLLYPGSEGVVIVYKQDPRIEAARQVTYDEVKASLQKEGWSEGATNRAALACSLVVFREVDKL